MSEITTSEVDVLIVGSGLSGFRAGISALDFSKKARVAIVSDAKGPSGSSFTNLNNALGLLVCHTDIEKELFVKRAQSIAYPGTIDLSLVKILAENSERIFSDLNYMGFKFKKDPNGNPMRFPACFLNEKPLAYIFTNLEHAHFLMKNRYLESGGVILEGWVFQDFIAGSSKGISGVLFESACGKQKMGVMAKAVVIAAGGCAPLFQRTVSRSGPHGFAHPLMKRAGAQFVNLGYFQYIWYETKGLNHWSPSLLAQPGFRLKNSNGSIIEVPLHIRQLSKERSCHVPAAHGLPDSELDNFLFKHLDGKGELEIYNPDKGWIKVAPFSHASNGGVVIYENGGTGVQGLFACGETAGGMHGANRVGGAMVLSTQVFGERAGISAARLASGRVCESNNSFRNAIKDAVLRNPRCETEWLDKLPCLKKQMQKIMIQGGIDEKRSYLKMCKDRLKKAVDWRFKLALETIILILEKTTNNQINTG